MCFSYVLKKTRITDAGFYLLATFMDTLVASATSV
mgnify:FL=1